MGKVTPKVEGKTLLVCDASSNFMSRKIDWGKHALVYAGAQKNIGPAGVTVVIVREDLLGKELKECPTGMSYQVFAKADSMYNTPSCYAIYVMGLYLKYTLANGGIEKCDQLAQKRSDLLYDCIENSEGFFSCPVDKTCRSRMNVPFVIKGDDAALTKQFLAETKAVGMAKLADFMDKFRAKHSGGEKRKADQMS